MFNNITSKDNLFAAWEEFRNGKKKRKDVAEFELNLEDNIFDLYNDLQQNIYEHGSYYSFFVCDPKRRHIHKAGVRDRLLHHAVVRVIEPLFDPAFVYDSWSCRKGKGIHKGVDRFRQIAGRLSLNNTKNLWVLKMDIRKFFESIDHDVLINQLSKVVKDFRTMRLLEGIIDSFSPGLPLGNLTSQLFANVYMNDLDQYAKHTLKAKGYIRYADDFVFLHPDKDLLLSYIPQVEKFLSESLKLKVHPKKIILGKYRSGVDFLGYISFPTHKILRTRTKNRMLRRVVQRNFASYSGQLSHCRSYDIRKTLLGTLKAQRKAAFLKRQEERKLVAAQY